MSRLFTVVLVVDNQPQVFGTFTTSKHAHRVAGYVRNALPWEVYLEHAVDVQVCRINYADEAARAALEISQTYDKEVAQ